MDRILIILRPARAQNLFGRNYFLIPKIPRKTATDVGRPLEEDIDELQQVIESQILKEGR